ncbi:hypothetical protein H0E87_021456 [Populus deltoides]|uniref:Beta-glucosidase n=1 Tax=Populus deltoides TaxID=3696 RepID=A0A8T2XFH1_POPDE|nr:hypothetical protein H0E87_021456 [Populus deltoides]
MRAKALPFLIFCLSIVQCFSHAAESNGASEKPETVSFETAGGLRHSFPKGFVFGTATSAYQVEGMAEKDGRGPSIWDEFVKIPGIVANNATGEVAVDQYHHYKEDVDIMKMLNFDAYRFSISWSRIFPDGTGKVNWLGVAYYNRLIDYMIEKGITPYANLYHYDLPLALEKKYKGLLSYQEKQKGRIGILLDFVYYEPLTSSKADNLAAQRARDFHIGCISPCDCSHI